MERKKTIFDFTGEYDKEFPPLEAEYIVPWQKFVRDFESKDMKFTEDLKTLCENKTQRLMDFRPYMIPNPYTVATTDPLEKCV
jgi:hypothetical protein